MLKPYGLWGLSCGCRCCGVCVHVDWRLCPRKGEGDSTDVGSVLFHALLCFACGLMDDAQKELSYRVGRGVGWLVG